MVASELPVKLNPLKEWVCIYVQGYYPGSISVRTLMLAIAVDKILPITHNYITRAKEYSVNNVRATLKALVEEGRLTARKMPGGRGMRYGTHGSR